MPPLQYIHHHDKDNDYKEWDSNNSKYDVIQGNSHDESRQEDKHHNEIHHGKPPVLGSGVAKDLAEG